MLHLVYEFARHNKVLERTVRGEWQARCERVISLWSCSALVSAVRGRSTPR